MFRAARALPRLRARGISLSAVEINHDAPNLATAAAAIYAEHGCVVVRGLNKEYVEVCVSNGSGRPRGLKQIGPLYCHRCDLITHTTHTCPATPAGDPSRRDAHGEAVRAPRKRGPRQEDQRGWLQTPFTCALVLLLHDPEYA
jgi:hypothetical protein